MNHETAEAIRSTAKSNNLAQPDTEEPKLIISSAVYARQQ